jgi:hypothetical protein
MWRFPDDAFNPLDNRYERAEQLRDSFGGRPALGYEWETGVSVVAAWHVHVSDRVLLWAACEAHYAFDGSLYLPAAAVGREIFAHLVIDASRG